MSGSKGPDYQINTRPVYFFLRKSLEERFSYSCRSDIYETLEEMRNELKAATDKKHAFMNLIGTGQSELCGRTMQSSCLLS